MAVVDDLLASGLARRLRQHAAAADASLAAARANPTPGTVAGAFKDTVLGTLLGLPAEGSAALGNAVAGELVGGAAALQAGGAERGLPGFDPQSSATQSARQINAVADDDPRRALEVARTGPDSGTAWLAGALSLVADPLNYVGGLGQAAQAAQFTRLAGALRAVDRAQALPFELLAKGAQAGLRRAEGPAVARAAAERLAAAFRHDPATSGPVGGVNGGLPQRELPTIGGAPGYGPVPSPAVVAALRRQVQDEAARPLPTPVRGDVLGGWVGRAIDPRLRDVPLGDGPSQVPRPDPLVARAAEELRTPPPPAIAAAPPPKAIQPPSALVAAAGRTARPTPQDQLLGAARALAGRDVPPRARPRPADPPAAAPGQLPLPDESGVVPPQYDRRGLDAEQFALLDGLAEAVRRGDPAEIAALRDLATRGYDIPAARVTAVVDELAPAPAAAGDRTPAPATADDLAPSPADTPPAGGLTAPPPDPAAPADDAGALAALRRLMRSGDDGRDMHYPPNDPAFYARRLGLPAEAVPGLLRRLEEEGTLGRDQTGALLVRPPARADAPAPAPPGPPPAPRPLPDVPDSGPPPGAVTADEERAAARFDYPPDVPPRPTPPPDFPAPVGDRTSILRALPDGQRETLLRVAYGVPERIAAARAKYPDPADLADAALARITSSSGAVARLNQADPALARTIAFLPEPAGATDPLPAPGLVARGQQAAADLFSDAADTKLLALPPAAAARALVGAAGGGLGGGLAGATQGATPEERLQNAATGALTGALLGGSAGRAAPQLAGAARRVAGPLLDPLTDPDNTWRRVAGVARERGAREQAAANAAIGDQALFPGLRGLGAIWRSNTITHPKNLLQDEGSGRLFLRGAQGGQASDLLAPIRSDMAGRLALKDPWSREPSLVQDPLIAIGKTGYVPQLGDSLAHAEATLAAPRSTAQEATGAALLSLANPVGLATNALGVAASGALGAVRPWLRGAFRGINDFQQASFRRAAFADELDEGLRLAADSMLPRLQAAGIPTAALDAGGKFSPADLDRLGAGRLADDWRALSDKAVALAEGRAKFIFGDYTKRSPLERALGGVIPFLSWSYRAYPVAAQMAAQHPGVALAVYRLVDATSRGAGADGRPGYTAGMVPITTETPLVGPIVRAMLGGQDGVGYVDPVNAFSPVGGNVLQPAAPQAGERNWYQSANDFLGRVGLPGANPAVQATAYVLGLDYKAPGALSRTQGLENALALVPGNPALPDVGGGTLRAARGAVSPQAAAAGLPGARGERRPQAYDPLTRRYAELVLAQTGRTLDDRANLPYLVGLVDGTNPLLQQARREVLLGGAAKNAVSLTSPVGVTTQGADAAATLRAQQGLPYAPAQLAGSSPAVAAVMAGRNAQYQAATPAARAYTVGSAGEAETLLLQEWDRRNALLQRASPPLFQARRAAYLAQLRAGR